MNDPKKASVRPPPDAFGAIEEIDAGADVFVCGLSDVGCVRTNNEDAFAVVDLASDDVVDVAGSQTLIAASPRGVLLVVSDGMGGENAGEVASALVVETARAAMKDAAVEEDPARALAAAIEQANERVAAAAIEPGREGMGATVIAVLVCGSYAYTAEVGDSRAYLLRGGAITQLSKDQTHVQVLVDQGLLEPAKAKTSRAKSVVLQACGKSPELVVAQRRLALRERDKLLLCSDGLTAHLEDADIAAILEEAAHLDEACAKLVALAKERGGQDNITVIAAEVGGSLPAVEAGETIDDCVETLRAFTVTTDPP